MKLNGSSIEECLLELVTSDDYHGCSIDVVAGNESDSAQQYKNLYMTSQFITGLILYPLFCLMGFCGNILTVVVLLAWRRVASSTDVYLISLALADFIKIIFDFFYFLSILQIKLDLHEGSNFCAQLYPYAHYFFHMSVYCSAWITVAVAFERFIFCCKPIYRFSINSLAFAIKTSVLIFVLTTVTSLPLLFRYTSEATRCGDELSLVTVAVTGLWRNERFSFIYTLIHLLLRTVLPIVIVAVLNVFIICAVWRSKRSSGASIGPAQRITRTLVAVIVVFIVCVIPDAILSLSGYGYVEEQNYLVKAIREFSDLLLLVNSAVNFILYCSLNSMFRQKFVGLFCQSSSTEHNHLQLTQRSLHATTVLTSLERRNQHNTTETDCHNHLTTQKNETMASLESRQSLLKEEKGEAEKEEFAKKLSGNELKSHEHVREKETSL